MPHLGGRGQEYCQFAPGKPIQWFSLDIQPWFGAYLVASLHSWRPEMVLQHHQRGSATPPPPHPSCHREQQSSCWKCGGARMTPEKPGWEIPPCVSVATRKGQQWYFILPSPKWWRRWRTSTDASAQTRLLLPQPRCWTRRPRLSPRPQRRHPGMDGWGEMHFCLTPLAHILT